jgi:uncharacterized protein YsxB (DUF464 family)
MVTIQAALDADGVLRSCAVKGHAQSGPMGQDIVCAAVSVLSRTAVTLLSQAKGVTLRVNAPRRGELYFEADYDASGRQFLCDTAAFLLEGFESIARDYPVNCRIKICRGGVYPRPM